MEDTLVAAPDSNALHAWIRQYYGKILTKQDDLQTNACCAADEPPAWIQPLLTNVHPEVLGRFYGCGFPIPPAAAGATVLDLGCGSGRDVYLISQVVGPTGRVHGLDMTEEQLAVAAEHAGWHAERFGYDASNVRFHHGYIEELDALPLEPSSIDIIVSNCVLNLSPKKDRVMEGAFALLRPGGELLLSDVVVDRRLSAAVQDDPVLLGECLGGALYRHDLLDLARHVGFADPRIVAEHPITIEHEALAARVGAARFSSLTLRLLKVEGLEGRCEDYGQVATYHGSIPDATGTFWLDDHHAFETGRPERVCGNTASMLTGTRFAEHFTVVGDRSVHYGEFPCGPTLAAAAGVDDNANGATRCC